MQENKEINQLSKPDNNFRSNFKKFALKAFNLLKIVIAVAIIVLPIRYFLFQPFIVKGESMIPNLSSGDYLIIDEISYKIREPKRGEIIVLRYPLDKNQLFIKRIIGLPGETINIKDGKITISKGQASFILNENGYLPSSKFTIGNIRVELGSEQYFVLGDNRQFSFDSRAWGVLEEQDVVGKASLRLFPVTNISLIGTPNY